MNIYHNHTEEHPDDVEDPFHGTPQQESQKEMIQIYGGEKPDHEWILTDYDVWQKNPYFTGIPTNEHPEDNRLELAPHGEHSNLVDC